MDEREVFPSHCAWYGPYGASSAPYRDVLMIVFTQLLNYGFNLINLKAIVHLKITFDDSLLTLRPS